MLLPENSHNEGHSIFYNKLEFYSHTKIAQNIIICSLDGFTVEIESNNGFGAFVDAQLGTPKVKRPC